MRAPAASPELHVFGGGRQSNRVLLSEARLHHLRRALLLALYESGARKLSILRQRLQMLARRQRPDAAVRTMDLIKLIN